MKKSAQKQPDLSIVIPAYREEKRIGKTLDKLASFINTNKLFRDKTIEVLVVSTDSKDKTRDIVKAKSKLFRQFVFLQPGAVVGKGRDVQYGMLRASGKHIIFMDADLSTPLHHIEDFYKECEAGADIVIGTRDLRVHHPNPARRFVSRIGNVLFKLLGDVWAEDSQCGFKMFNQQASQFCFGKLRIMGWGFDMEILAIAQANNLSMKNMRIDDWEDKPYSTYSDAVIKNSLLSLRDLLQILVNRINHNYTK